MRVQLLGKGDEIKTLSKQTSPFSPVMRYQRVSPDCLPHSPLSSTHKKSSLKPTMCKEEGSSCSNDSNIYNVRSMPKDIEGAKVVKYRSPCTTKDHLHHSIFGVGGNGGVPNSPPKAAAQTEITNLCEMPKKSETTSSNHCDVLLQWGQRKRARVSRSEIRPLTDDSSSSTVPRRQPLGNKVYRRILHETRPLAPPPPPSSMSKCSTPRNDLLSSRNPYERSTAAGGSPSRNSCGTSRAASRSTAGKHSPLLETIDRKTLSAGSVKDEKKNGSELQADRLIHAGSAPVQTENAGGAANSNSASVAGVGEKVNLEVIEWPRIYIALSRKEKEDDFLAIKGTKLPQRPKKRAKNVDGTLQYCFPGMWLSDLTKSRYEVREKKSVKKQKRRGLKGMEWEGRDSE